MLPMPLNARLTPDWTVAGSLEKALPAADPTDENIADAREVTPDRPFVMPDAMLVTVLLTAVVALDIMLGEYATDVMALLQPELKLLTAARAGPVSALVSFESDDVEVDVALLTSASALAWADFAAVSRSVAAR